MFWWGAENNTIKYSMQDFRIDLSDLEPAVLRSIVIINLQMFSLLAPFMFTSDGYSLGLICKPVVGATTTDNPYAMNNLRKR